MNRAIEVLKKTKTMFGYVVHEEYWSDIDSTDKTPITTAYTTDGYWIGDEKTAKILCDKHGIYPIPRSGIQKYELRPCSIGFSKKNKKWYGWSHRALNGFKIGSKVKMGDCGYVPVDWDDFVQDSIRFWTDDYRSPVKTVDIIDETGVKCIEVHFRYSNDIKNEKLRGEISSIRSYPPEVWGHGEWEAKTLEDAKQMAIDFADGVS